MYRFESSDGDLGVNLGGINFGVAEHFLDVSDVRPVFQHHRGHGVAEFASLLIYANSSNFFNIT